jgi:hypothetical protein
MSIYTDCIETINLILTDRETVWTELDIIALAKWDKYDIPEVARQANQAIGNAFRRQAVCRYGPVTLPDGDHDYARIAGKIVYASADKGPEVFQTPNGDFPQLLWSRNNDLIRPGRLPANNRDDREPWTDQDFKVSAGSLLTPAKIEDLHEIFRREPKSLAEAKRSRKKALKVLEIA